jgi:hypothetical protein
MSAIWAAVLAALGVANIALYFANYPHRAYALVSGCVCLFVAGVNLWHR